MSSPAPQVSPKVSTRKHKISEKDTIEENKQTEENE